METTRQSQPTDRYRNTADASSWEVHSGFILVHNIVAEFEF